MSKIIILMPYFGKWPFWMELFIEGCRRNPTIDWYFISDCGKPPHCPDNVFYQEMSFSDYKKLVSEKLSIQFEPESAYKVCDIRPAFGFLHAELVQGYDFWAFGDLDLVYGDLRRVYSDAYISQYNLISNHATRVSGHLCLIRNTEYMNTLFRKIPQWQQRFADQTHQALDERAFSKLFVKHKNFPAWLRKPLVLLLYPLTRKCSFVERYTTPNGCVAWRDGSFTFPEEWFWSGAGISNSLQPEPDMPYFHFAVWKKSAWPNAPLDNVPYEPGKVYRFSSRGIDTVETQI